MNSYTQQTIDAPNPLVRYAHRSRLCRSLALALPRLGGGKLLDYGCGSGAFIAEVLKHHPGRAIGYEPLLTERSRSGLPIYARVEEAEKAGPYSIMTLFETIEHLTASELEDFTALCSRLLPRGCGVLMSAPIEIGPALLLKDLHRSGWGRQPSEHRALELLKASLLGIAARRAENVKTSHRGFDFRRARCALRELGWTTQVLGYGPLPLPGWYGNSQVYLWAERG
jgi:2-polyprenyl-3-methyl-5-hydroxy-6-metoxy-1,4-benzoquinol methylase